MGAIAGILGSDGGRIDPALLSAMLQSIAHRGPDGQGAFCEGHAGIAAAWLDTCGPRPAALSAIPSGRQPLHSADKSLAIAFDGEIFNDGALRSELKRRGHQFSTTSDAEVALCAYEEYGEDCVLHFNGQWALAVWDSRRRRLFASRDRLGVRPFYYSAAGRDFLFASEIKALLQHPRCPREIDLVALDQVFTLRAAIPPRTIFRHVFELPPGFSLLWSDGVVQVFRHWQIDFLPEEPQSGFALEEELGELLLDATRLRLRSCAGIAAGTGHGFESSLTAALVGRSSEASTGRLSIEFDDPAGGAGARRNGQHIVHCATADIGRVFRDVVAHAETPLVTTAPAAMYLLSRFAREQGFKVLVSETGAAELFGGCDIYKEARVRRFWGRLPDSQFRLQLLQRVFSDPPGFAAFPTAYWQAFFHARPGDLANPFFSHLARWEQTARLRGCFSPAVLAEIGDYDARDELRLRLPAHYKRWDPLCQAQFLEISGHLPGCLLSSQHDRMSMAHGVAERFPFLDHRVAALAARLPARAKLKGLSENDILKRIAARFVPAWEMRVAPRAEPAPAAAGFFGTPDAPRACDYVDELLSREKIDESGLFDAAGVERLVRKARKGEALAARDGMALVGILSTQLLIDQFVAPPAARPLSETCTALA